MTRFGQTRSARGQAALETALALLLLTLALSVGLRRLAAALGLATEFHAVWDGWPFP